MNNMPPTVPLTRTANADVAVEGIVRQGSEIPDNVQPVMIGGSDGANAQVLSVLGDGSITVNLSDGTLNRLAVIFADALAPQEVISVVSNAPSPTLYVPAGVAFTPLDPANNPLGHNDRRPGDPGYMVQTPSAERPGMPTREEVKRILERHRHDTMTWDRAADAVMSLLDQARGAGYQEAMADVRADSTAPAYNPEHVKALVAAADSFASAWAAPFSDDDNGAAWTATINPTRLAFAKALCAIGVKDIEGVCRAFGYYMDAEDLQDVKGDTL